MLLGLVAEILVGCIALQVLECLSRVEVHLRLPVHSLVVNLGRLCGGIFLDFAAIYNQKNRLSHVNRSTAAEELMRDYCLC